MRLSFFTKLAALFLAIIVVLGVVIAAMSVRAALQFSGEAEQKLNAPLADQLAMEFQPLLHSSIDEDSLANRIEYVLGINRRIELYLLGGNGMIKASFLEDGSPAVPAVETTQLDAFLSGEPLPLLGPDPRNPGKLKPFSVASIEIMGEPDCYLYVILTGQRYASAAAMVRDSYLLQTTLRGLGLAVLLAAIVGVLLFSLLTKRLRRMEDSVSAFAEGDYSRRVDIGARDEIGRLGSSFNNMADRLTSVMDDLRRTDQLRRELVANVSHDLRSPLASIRGYVETILLKDETLTDEKRAEYLRVVLANTESLSDLVTSLFDLSRLDAEQVTPELEPFSVAELVQDVVQQFAPIASEAGVSLVADLQEENAYALGDIGLVERALSNLIDNAIRFTASGGEVRISPLVTASGIEVTVADTGVGIPAEEVDLVFDRFYRVEKSRTKEAGGSGLGLAIAQKIINLHGGSIRVQSELNRGTAFSFSLAGAAAPTV